MRSYLRLISISTKVRKKQSRMTVLCIVIAVFLVTIVFSMTDMLMRAELSHPGWMWRRPGGLLRLM